MKTFRTNICSCPNCGHIFDSASAVKIEEAPKDGDLSVCVYCAAFLKFNPDLSLSLLSDEEFVELSYDNRKTLNNVRISLIKQRENKDGN